jgi:argininosuccinate lyase
MHLGKSRNDQVVTAIRITLREEMLQVAQLLIDLENALLRFASKHTRTVFPGYTHLQPAQPISFAHYLVALGDAFLRDVQRVLQAYDRINKSPMGAAALAGTSFNLNRHLVASLLGFSGLVENSLDAVGSRDFAAETLGVCAITALDVTRFVQDLIFYSAADVGLISIPDEFTSTSSIMPQKKNPDPLEVIRARCAQVVGNFMSASTTLHALPSGFNLDFQEVTPLLWSSIDTITSSLKFLAELTSRIKVESQIAKRSSFRFTVATEIANVLVREEKLPFRTAHHAVGRAVKSSLSKDLRELTQAEWEQILGKPVSYHTFKLMRESCDLERSLESFRTAGSPHPTQTEAGIRRRRIEASKASREIYADLGRIRRSALTLQSKIRSV